MESNTLGTDDWPIHQTTVRGWSTMPDLRVGGQRPPREDRMLETISVSIPPHIADLTPTLSSHTTVALEHATTAIVGLDRESSVRLGALSGFLLRSESIATSKIERVDADLNDIARALAGETAGSEAVQTAAAVKAVQMLSDAPAGTPFTVEEINLAHRELLEDDRLEGRDAGRLRDVQNWIGPNEFTPRGALYVPPPPERVPDLMADLVTFANRTDMPALAQAAIVHAQFESIHPYTDGNGRIGRALIHAVLRRRGTTTRVVIPIASVWLSNLDAYFADLDKYRSGQVDELVRFTANAAALAAEESATSASELESLPEVWRANVKPRLGSSTDKLIAHLVENPVLTDRIAAQAIGSSVRRASDAINRLEDAGVLSEVTGRSRNRVWVADEVLHEIDRLEERIGRRQSPDM